jgi:sugar lactone lactonase YvrE
MHKPAFAQLVSAVSGEVWVLREGPSERLEDGVEDPLEAGWEGASENAAWRSRWIIDVFSPDGRYLGEVEAPQGIQPSGPRFFVDDRTVVAVVEDVEGTIMVKRYRLVLPGEQ